jgi:hypothetical protein
MGDKTSPRNSINGILPSGSMLAAVCLIIPNSLVDTTAGAKNPGETVYQLLLKAVKYIIQR